MKAPREKPFGLDMSFDDALRRFIATDPKEVEALAPKKGRQRPKPPPPPGSELDQLSAGDNTDEPAPHAGNGRAGIP